MSDCVQSSTPKARKEHRCYFCNEAILPGEKYHYRTGKNSDGFWTIHTHFECNEATSDWTDDDYECFSGGYLKRGTTELK